MDAAGQPAEVIPICTLLAEALTLTARLLESSCFTMPEEGPPDIQKDIIPLQSPHFVTQNAVDIVHGIPEQWATIAESI